MNAQPRFTDKTQHDSQLFDWQTRVSPGLSNWAQHLLGDVMILGAGGKMGPWAACMAANAIRAVGGCKKVYAVARWSDPTMRAMVEKAGVCVIEEDLLRRGVLRKLREVPNVSNVYFYAGMKFGSSGLPARTWQMNVQLPGQVADIFSDSIITSVGSGNVVPFTAPSDGGAVESVAPSPIGEYAWTTLGRERAFEYAASEFGSKVCNARLFYANETRYGVLVDIAMAVFSDQPVKLTMPAANVIPQPYANEAILRCSQYARNPAKLLHIVGPQIDVRATAERFGEIFGKIPTFGEEVGTVALLGNGDEMLRLMGPIDDSTEDLIQMIANWIIAGGEILNKGTGFTKKDGQF